MRGSRDEIIALVTKAKTGDRAVFDALYQEYVTPLFRFVYFRVHNRQEAEDVTQTIFLKVWETLPPI